MVLDTCAVIWLAFDRDKISPNALRQIDSSDNLIINTLSFWEIGIKISKKKLSIPISVSKLVELVAGNANFKLVAPDNEIVLNSLELKWKHKDPVDRFIVATAKKYNDVIVTADSVIQSFYKRTII